jgi:hypothetical protein
MRPVTVSHIADSGKMKRKCAATAHFRFGSPTSDAESLKFSLAAVTMHDLWRTISQEPAGPAKTTEGHGCEVR